MKNKLLEEIKDFSQVTSITVQPSNEGHPLDIVQHFVSLRIDEVFFKTQKTLDALSDIFPTGTFRAEIHFRNSNGRIFYLDLEGNIFDVEWNQIGTLSDIPPRHKYYYGYAELRDGENEYYMRGTAKAATLDEAQAIFREKWQPDDYRILDDAAVEEITKEEFEILNRFL